MTTDIRIAIAPVQAGSTDIVGSVIDSEGFGSRVVYALACRPPCPRRSSPEDTMWAYFLDESDDGATFRPVEIDDVVEHARTPTSVGKVEYIGSKRFTRLTLVPLGEGALAVTAMALLERTVRAS